MVVNIRTKNEPVSNLTAELPAVVAVNCILWILMTKENSRRFNMEVSSVSSSQIGTGLSPPYTFCTTSFTSFNLKIFILFLMTHRYYSGFLPS